MNLAELNSQLGAGTLKVSDAINQAFDLGKDENSIEQLVQELHKITNNFPFIEYYSHENADCFNIMNEYTDFQSDKQVLCRVDEGFKKAITTAVEVIKTKKNAYNKVEGI